jgi:peptidoglycan/LPS O-acetylase OafA/YrhL
MKNLGNQMKSMHQAKQPFYRPEIDGIRAFAVIAVIINHFNKKMLPSGYLGVDIFFVISGFVITSSLAGRSSKDFSDFLVGFYTRRIKRLVPALVTFVLVTGFLICLFNPSPGISLKTGITSLFGLSNLYLLKQSTDYFAPSTELNVFTHTWSLGVEEQFYFLFPLLVWFTGFGRLATKGSRNLFWVIGVMSVASLIAFIYCHETNQQPAAYFLMPTRLWELGAGCLLFLGLEQSNVFFRTLERIPPLIVIGIVTSVLFAPSNLTWKTTIAIVVLTAVLIICIRSGTTAYNLFTHPRVVYIGLISYSLYLWHWGVLALSRWTIGIHWWSIPFQVALMLLLAITSYRYIETPLRRSDWSADRWKSILYGMGTSATTALLLFSLVKIPNLSLYTGRIPSLVATGVPSLTNTYSLKQVNSLWKGEKCFLSDNSHVGKKIFVEDCTLGDFSNAKKRVMVLGDSFSTSFTQAFDDLVVLDKYSVTITSSWQSSPVQEIPNKSPLYKINNHYWDSIVPSLIKPLKQGDWVFLVNDMSRFSPSVSRFSPLKESETNESLKQLENGLKSLSDKLSARGIRLAVLHGISFARDASCQPVIASKQWFNIIGNGGPCQLPNRRDSLQRRDNLNKVLVSLEKEGKLRIVDLFDVFCPEDQCTYNAKNGQLLYRDEHSHPSVESARLSSPIIRKVLTSS